MFFVREVPSEDCLRNLSGRYPDLDPSTLGTIVTFLRTASDLVEGFEKRLALHGLSQGRFSILTYLNRKPDHPANQTQLAEAYGVAKATITGLIDGLERDGLVERLPDPTDRRASLVQLTKAGCEFLDAILPHHYRCVSALLAGFDAKDRETLQALMRKLEAGLVHVADLEKSGLMCRAPDVCCRPPVHPPASS